MTEPTAEFREAWVRIAPKHYIDAPRPDLKSWAVRLGWDVWQAALETKRCSACQFEADELGRPKHAPGCEAQDD